MSKALDDQNFCSIKGDNILEVSTNAYYFKSNNLQSGEHISRLSIRTISDGYQRYKIGGTNYLLDRSKYLVINEGEKFESEISTNNPIEGILVAFENKQFQEVQANLRSSHKNLLDNPFHYETGSFDRKAQSTNLSPHFAALMFELRNQIFGDGEGKLVYEELFYKILAQIFNDLGTIQKRISNLKGVKRGTREEIYSRIRDGKEYMDANLHEDISLKKLSQVATMSQFHFLRNFTCFYEVTPHKYLTNKRIEKSKFLLKDTNLTLEEIIEKVGFQNKSSFSRLFKQKLNTTPFSYRNNHYKQ